MTIEHHLTRDPRTMEDTLILRSSMSRERMHHAQSDLLMSSRASISGPVHAIGDQLQIIGFAPQVFEAWASVLNGVPRNEQHQGNNAAVRAGCLLSALAESTDTFQVLRNLDPACRVTLELHHDVRTMEDVLDVCIRVPLTVAHRMGRGLDASSATVSRQQRVETFDSFDGSRHAVAIGNPMYAVSINDVELGTLSNINIVRQGEVARQLSTRTLTEQESDNERRNQQALAEEKRKRDNAEQLERQKAILRGAEAVQVPQGTIAPRKSKRVSVDTDLPTTQAESPRRLTLRRDRKN